MQIDCQVGINLMCMKRIKPATRKVAEEIALPILLDGYRKRKQVQSNKERSKRSKVKLTRDDEFEQAPRILVL